MRSSTLFAFIILAIFFLLTCKNLSNQNDKIFLEIVEKFDRKDSLWNENIKQIDEYLQVANTSEKMELLYIKGFYQYYNLNDKEIGIKTLKESKNYLKESSANVLKKNAIHISMAKVYFNSQSFEMAHQNIEESFSFLQSQKIKNSDEYKIAELHANVIKMGILQEEKKIEEAYQQFEVTKQLSKNVATISTKQALDVLQDFYYTSFLLHLRKSESDKQSSQYLHYVKTSVDYLQKAIQIAIKKEDKLAQQNFRTVLPIIYTTLIENEPENTEEYIEKIHAEFKAAQEGEKNLIPEFKQRIYQVYSYIYGLKPPYGNLEKMQEYTKKNDSIRLVIRNKNAIINNDTISDLSKEKNEEISKQKTYFTIFLGCLSIFIVGFIFYFLYSQRKLKRERYYFQKITENLRNQLSIPNYIESNKVQAKTEDFKEPHETNFTIPAETEEKLLKALQKFEKNKKFRNNKLTQSSLSKELETNPKYLSETIKKNFDKNFNNYINDLRIEYIITKLYNDKKFRQFKVNYLAEHAGFSSYDTFKLAFKNKTNMLPSSFIKFLNEENSDPNQEV